MPVKILNVSRHRCSLGEGIYYSARYNSVFWVDIKQQLLYRMDYASRAVTSIPMPEQIGWVKETRSGRFIVGLQSGIYWLNDDLSCGKCFLQLSEEPAGNRLNDAKTDQAGRLYFGSMDDSETAPCGSLYQLANLNENPTLHKVDSGYVVSNGPAFNLAGDRLYSVSSATRTIYAFTVDGHGQLSHKRQHIVLPEHHGYPDGITVDSHDNLWVACWQGHGLCYFDPAGKLIERIVLPAPQITNVTFGGPAYSTLFVTSACTGMDDDALNRYPLAGSVFELDVGVTGVPEPRVKDN